MRQIQCTRSKNIDAFYRTECIWQASNLGKVLWFVAFSQQK